jgi:competence ComEA-like helix-hairpin-helix protein
MDPKKRIRIILSLPIFITFLFMGQVYAQGGHTGGLGEKKVPLNIATEDQLLKIEGMTEALAAAIVEYRKNVGFFDKPEDLLKVPGMTEEKYKELNPQVGVEGDIYCIQPEGEEDDEWDEEDEPVLAPSKC